MERWNELYSQTFDEFKVIVANYILVCSLEITADNIIAKKVQHVFILCAQRHEYIVYMMESIRLR